MDRSIRMFLQHSTGGGGKIEKSASIPQAAFLRNAFSLAPFLRVILLHTLVHSHRSNDFLFISDTIKEIVAAHEAGMQAILCKRDMHGFESSQSNIVIHSFEEIFPD